MPNRNLNSPQLTNSSLAKKLCASIKLENFDIHIETNKIVFVDSSVQVHYKVLLLFLGWILGFGYHTLVLPIYAYIVFDYVRWARLASDVAMTEGDIGRIVRDWWAGSVSDWSRWAT